MTCNQEEEVIEEPAPKKAAFGGFGTFKLPGVGKPKQQQEVEEEEEEEEVRGAKALPDTLCKGNASARASQACHIGLGTH